MIGVGLLFSLLLAGCDEKTLDPVLEEQALAYCKDPSTPLVVIKQLAEHGEDFILHCSKGILAIYPDQNATHLLSSSEWLENHYEDRCLKSRKHSKGVYVLICYTADANSIRPPDQ